MYMYVLLRQLEEPLLTTAKAKMMALAKAVTDAETANNETKFVEEAVLQLLKARRVLKCSYAYGYYLAETGYKKPIFEFMQVRPVRFRIRACCMEKFYSSKCHFWSAWWHVSCSHYKFLYNNMEVTVCIFVAADGAGGGGGDTVGDDRSALPAHAALQDHPGGGAGAPQAARVPHGHQQGPRAHRLVAHLAQAEGPLHQGARRKTPPLFALLRAESIACLNMRN